jgi:hypothetical protein
MISNCDNQVYDSTYGGFSTSDGLLLTRIANTNNFVLDQIGESSLPVDLKAEELFQ